MGVLLVFATEAFQTGRKSPPQSRTNRWGVSGPHPKRFLARICVFKTGHCRTNERVERK